MISIKMTGNCLFKGLIGSFALGEARGIQQGIRQEKVAIAELMLNKGLSIELIAQVTGLEQATIEPLR